MTEDQFNKIMGRLDDVYNLLKGSISNTGNGTPVVLKKSESTARWNSILEEKQPQSDYERIALLVNFLNLKATSDNIIDFIRENPDSFVNTTEKSLRKVIENTVYHQHYKYIELTNEEEKKHYRLTIKGKQLVNTLPNRPVIEIKKKRVKSRKNND